MSILLPDLPNEGDNEQSHAHNFTKKEENFIAELFGGGESAPFLESLEKDIMDADGRLLDEDSFVERSLSFGENGQTEREESVVDSIWRLLDEYAVAERLRNVDLFRTMDKTRQGYLSSTIDLMHRFQEMDASLHFPARDVEDFIMSMETDNSKYHSWGEKKAQHRSDVRIHFEEFSRCLQRYRRLNKRNKGQHMVGKKKNDSANSKKKQNKNPLETERMRLLQKKKIRDAHKQTKGTGVANIMLSRYQAFSKNNNLLSRGTDNSLISKNKKLDVVKRTKSKTNDSITVSQREKMRVEAHKKSAQRNLRMHLEAEVKRRQQLSRKVAKLTVEAVEAEIDAISAEDLPSERLVFETKKTNFLESVNAVEEEYKRAMTLPHTENILAIRTGQTSDSYENQYVHQRFAISEKKLALTKEALKKTNQALQSAQRELELGKLELKERAVDAKNTDYKVKTLLRMLKVLLPKAQGEVVSEEKGEMNLLTKDMNLEERIEKKLEAINCSLPLWSSSFNDVMDPGIFVGDGENGISPSKIKQIPTRVKNQMEEYLKKYGH
eukprot:g887.t1